MAAMDDDFDDLMDDIDFDLGDSKKKGGKPKNLVFSTGLDVASGIKESLNPMDKISNIVKELMPSAVRSEYSDLETAIKEIKEETEKGLESVTSSLKDVSKAISGLLPEGSVKEKLKAFGTKETYSSDYKSKEQQEKEKIDQAILEAFGEAQSDSKRTELVKEALSEQRQANSQAVLKHIYAELKAANHFNSRLTEKYYYKSLELQYKQLYKTSELVELTRVGWEANRKQLESIIINSSLPDMVKLKTLQAANDRRVAVRAKNSYLGSYFRRFNPFENLTKNIKSNINRNFTMWNESLQAALMGIDQAREFREQMAEFGGISPASLIGNQIGDFIRSNTLGRLGNRLGQTRQGRRFVFNFKDFMADPRYFLENQRNNIRGNGAMSKFARSALGTLSSLTGAPTKKTTEFINENLDDAKAFDGRVHQAIVKVIPGLLTDIRAILKTSTKVGDDEIANNRVYFDNKTGKFMSGDAIRKSIRSDLRSAIDNDGFKYHAQQLIGLLENNGATFDNKEKVKIARSLATFLMGTGTTSISPRLLQDPRLHKLVGGSTKNKLIAAASGLIIQAYNDPYVMDDIKSQLDGMRRSLPNMNNRLQDLHRSGHMELAGSLVTQDSRTGNYTLNDRSRDREIRRAIAGIDFGTDGALSGVSEEEVASALEQTRAQVNSAFGFVRESRVGRGIADRLGRARSFISNSRTAQNLRNAISSADNALGISAGVNRARNWATAREGELIALLDQDGDAFKQTLVNKKASIESIMTWENFKKKPKQIQDKLRSKFKDMQDTFSKSVKDIKEKGRAISRMSISEVSQEVKNQVTDVYNRAEKEISKVTKDFMEDAKDGGVTPEKIDAVKDKIKDIKKRADDEIKSRPRLQAAVANVKSKATATSASGQAMVSSIRNSRLGQAAEAKFNRVKSVAVESLKTFLNTDIESIKESLVQKKASIESLIPIEKLRNKSPELQKELSNKFNQAQDAVSKTVKEARSNLDKIVKDSKLDGNAKERAMSICKETEDEITEVCADFVENATKTGATPEKIDEFKAAVDSIRNNMSSRLTNDPEARVPKKRKMFRKTRAILGAGLWAGKTALRLGGKLAWWGTGGRVVDMYRSLKRNFGGSNDGIGLTDEPTRPDVGAGPIPQPSAANADLQSQVDKAERKYIKDQLEQQRQGSAKNIFSRRKKFLEANDGGRKKSGFLSKLLGKPMLYGGLGLAAVMLLQKLGFGLEDVAGFAKGFVNVAKTIASGVGKVVDGVVWVGKKIGSILDFFGIGGDDGEPGSKGEMAGKVAAGAAGLWAGKKVWNIGKGAGRLLGFGGNAANAAAKPGLLARGASWVGGKIGGGIKAVTSKIPSPSDVKKALSSVGDKVAKKFKPNVAKGIMAKLGKKLGVRTGMAMATAATGATGIGAPIAAVIGAVSLGMLAYDVYGIGRRMIGGKSLASAVSEHYLGVDVFDDNVTDETLSQDKEIVDGMIEVASEEAKINASLAANKDAIKDADNLSKLSNTSVEMARRETNNIFDSWSGQTGGANTNISSAYFGDQDKISQELSKMPNKPFYMPGSFVFEDKTSVSGWFESGGKPSTISTGKGDFGGQSYGKHQMIRSTVEAYLKQSRFGRYFKGLTPTTDAFNARWMEVTNKFGKEFADDQKAYIEKTHYSPVANSLQGIGLNIENRSQALKSAIFSIAVSRGANGAISLVRNALKFFKLSPVTATDKDIISAIYDYEYATIDSSYRSSSNGVKQSRKSRSVKEKALVLSLLNQQPINKDSGARIANKTNNVPASETNSESTTVASTNHENRNTSLSTVTTNNAKTDGFMISSVNANGEPLSRNYGMFRKGMHTVEQLQEFIDNSPYAKDFIGLSVGSNEFKYKWAMLENEQQTKMKFTACQAIYLKNGLNALKQHTAVLAGNTVNIPSPVTEPKIALDSKKNDMIQNVSYSPSIAKASEDMSSISNRTKGSVDTNTNSPTASQMMSILTQQLYVQNNMLKNLVQIATNTSVFSKFAEKQDKQNTEDNQPTMLPMPAVPLDRKENFTMNI